MKAMNCNSKEGKKWLMLKTDRLTPIPISIVCKTISKLNWNQMWILSKDKCWTVMVSFVFSENKYHEMLHNKLIKLPVINPDAFLSWMFWLHWLPDVFVKDDHSNGADDQGYYRLKKYIKDWIFVFCLPSLIIKVTNSFQR